MNAVYVLIMLFGTASHHGGHAVIQQEFGSSTACYAAEKELRKAHNGESTVLKASGCFRKGRP